MGISQSGQQIELKSELQNIKFIPELRVHSETWTRESHGLYDFEGNEVETSN